ncbi:UDP-glucose 4-epimerase [Candidatus Babeliales bacterium]|nr:UDP-glucose 4-epimerase [Candidatus Babeliales bacterium]
MEKYSILVTGGAGYIGSHVANAFAKAGHRVTILDTLVYGQQPPRINAKFIKGSCANSPLVENIFKKENIDTVAHLAAFIEVGESVKNPLKFYDNNVSATVNLLKTMALCNVKNILFSSSCAVYGPPQGPLCETHAKIPASPYGRTKLAVEWMIKDMANGIFNIVQSSCHPRLDLGSSSTSQEKLSLKLNNKQKEKVFLDCLREPRLISGSKAGMTKENIESEKKLTKNSLNYTIFRYFNAAGATPKQGLGEKHVPETHLIPLLIRAIQNNKSVKIFGTNYKTPDGTCIRDYVHVSDIANAHILALDFMQRTGTSNIFNLGTEKGFSVKEIINELEILMNKKALIKLCPRRAGDVSKLVAVTTKAKETLGWNAHRSSLKEILSDAIEWEQNKTLEKLKSLSRAIHF